MRLAVFEAMVLNLWRDRAAFALTFILPPAIFAVFAIVFSSAAGGDLSIRLGVVGPKSDDVANELIDGLEMSEFVDVLIRYEDRKSMETQIITGEIDAGIEITRAAPDAPPTFKILFDQAKRERRHHRRSRSCRACTNGIYCRQPYRAGAKNSGLRR